MMKYVNSLFEEPWFLDAVAPGKWRSVEVLRNNQVVARWTYIISRKFGQRIISNPPFCQTTGPWIAPNEGKKVAKLTYEKELLEELIDALGPGNVDLVLDSKRKYILPFRWRGFRYEPTFSYIFTDLSDIDRIFDGLASGIKGDIKKAQKKITVKEEWDIEILINLQDKTFLRQNRKNPMEKKILRRLDSACRVRNSCKLLVARDADAKIHSAAYFVYDENRCYYLFSGADPALRSSGAGSLVLWEGIKFASSVSKVFDFEGSNIEDIERFYRRFGAEAVVNYRVYRLNFFLMLTDYFKPKIKSLLKFKI